MRSSWLYFATRSERDGAPVLIWPQPVRHREVGDRRVLGLARAVRHDRRVAGLPRHARSPSSVSVSVPIWLTLTRIELATPESIPRRRRSVLVTNRSSPTSCTRSPIALGQRLPAVPVLLVHAVLDRDDRVAAGHARPSRRPSPRRERPALVLEHVGAAVVDLAGGGVERDRHVLAGRVAGGLDPRDQHLERGLVGVEVGREAALVADRRGRARVVQRPLERVEDLGADAQPLGEASARRPARP